MQENILVIDVGNTNMKLAVYGGTSLNQFWRITTQRDMTAEELWIVLRQLFVRSRFDYSALGGVVISTVVPSLLAALREVSRRHLGLEPLVFGPGIKTGLTIKTDHPAQVGSDRIASAIAALQFYGAPVIVIGLGTATTINVVDDKKQFLGGAILPGGFISAEALYQNTAQLPSVNITSPERGLSHDTSSSMMYGIVNGIAGQVDGIVTRMKEETGLPFTVVASGGLSELISPESRTIQHTHPDLVLEGLRIAWELNR
ncbi:type III pantothenate kinase [Paenibacillus doosanensis]|uniref:type III pantothenate kinase n=1 Tax=Paenibacillus doosanensis TaxID=1229154 RepID=UPI0021800F6C|nr:type III pantothenate kinase [Paenibacillus doosanensis]MCS7462608.1 type III pantothenate kinase [Paenibacillus doosanensis]